MSRESSEDPSQPSDQDDSMAIGDDELPEDLRPSEDNPLAQPVEDDVPDDLLTQGRGQADSGDGSEDASPTGGDGASDTPSAEASSEPTADDQPDSDESGS